MQLMRQLEFKNIKYIESKEVIVTTCRASATYLKNMQSALQ